MRDIPWYPANFSRHHFVFVVTSLRSSPRSQEVVCGFVRNVGFHGKKVRIDS